jgi:hypothetical protein
MSCSNKEITDELAAIMLCRPWAMTVDDSRPASLSNCGTAVFLVLLKLCSGDQLWLSIKEAIGTVV